MYRNRKQRIGVKYCGGCNPSYDRVALVKRMERDLSDEAEFFPFEARALDLILVVCGCETACVETSRFKGIPVRVIEGALDGEAVAEKIKEQGRNRGGGEGGN
ncbi:MAG: hypothetical protein P8Y00_00570 [Deltaproteobacteria bacterium]